MRGTTRRESVEVEGPWRHRYVSANGARFHLAETSADARRPLVLLLHGFPEFWWAWRDQLPALANSGYRAVAMDLRGYGASDKTPRGYDPVTLAADVAAVVQSLGSRRATLVGHGWGGYVAWTAATAHPELVSRLCAVAAPHPAAMLGSPGGMYSGRLLGHLLAMQVPWFPERAIMRGRYVGEHLRSWAGPESGFPTPEVAERYHQALSLWPSPHCALEYHRWLVRSRLRRDGRAFNALMSRRVALPVLHIAGAEDRAVPARAVAACRSHVSGELHTVSLPKVGHFPHEEDPGRFNRELIGWLSAGAPSGADSGG
ncbi:MAG: alpha/beta fold hydrolase [Sciscionella sp.]